MLRWFAGIALAVSVTRSDAQVIIPDPGLETAIREALQNPAGPLTQSNLLSLQVLSACCRNIKNLEGLEHAQNLRVLDLHSNSLTDAAALNSLPNLEIVDLFQNRLSSIELTNAPALAIVDLGFNSLTRCRLPSGLTSLDTLFLEGNQLTNFTLPSGLVSLTQLDLSANALSSFAFPPEMTNLVSALIFANQLTNLVVPSSLSRLANLDLDFNRLRTFNIPAGLTNFLRLTLFGNELTNLILPPDITKLGFLDVADNQLRTLNVPASFTNLNFLRASGNRLTSVVLSEGLTNLNAIFLSSNQLTSFTLPPGLTHLVQLDVRTNQITNLTLPADMTELVTLGLEGNPFAELVLSEPLATTGLSAVVTALESQGVSVFTFPLIVRLIRSLDLEGAFKFGITGPPGVYTVLGSTNLTAWSAVGVVTNPLGGANFHDVTTNVLPQKYYRVVSQVSPVLQVPPANMVFIPPNTFAMGSPTNELHRQPNDGPPTTVTLTRGFWIGKYEVTQGEYLSVTGTNPSQFPGDLTRPVSSVSWPDATNYCWMLTQRDFAVGRIAAGSQYRLPTEAEWECAARAGTTTRFSYGDDPDYSSLSNYAWQSLDDGLTVHPVGQKLPNPWGLYDMYGNVLEWCQDWFGPLPGGSVTDPHGPASNAIGDKVMRGGAFDFGGSFCRSASRLSFGSHPALTDWNLGFRVVLIPGPQ